MTGMWVLLGTLIAGIVAGGLLRRREGRVRRVTPPATLPRPVADVLAPDGITLVQLSTTFCAPCRHARAVLSRVADTLAGVTHVELDLTDLPDLAADLRVLRTPTTIVLQPDGTELLRVSGVPKPAALRESLAPLVRLTG